MKINLLFVNLIVRKTFFSILVLIFSIKSFSQFKQDTTIIYPDCFQFSPLFFIEPYSTCVNFTWEHHYQPKIYFSGSLGYIFDSNTEDLNIKVLEQNGVRLSFDLKLRLSSKVNIHPKLNGQFCIGIEPYFKYIKSLQYANFSIPWKEANQMTEGSVRDLRDSLSGDYLYSCERTQIGSIFKGCLKQSKKKFTLEIEAGFKVFYKIVTQGDVSPSLEYYSTNRHDMFSYLLFERYDNWAAMPFLNVKIGKRF